MGSIKLLVFYFTIDIYFQTRFACSIFSVLVVTWTWCNKDTEDATIPKHLSGNMWIMKQKQEPWSIAHVWMSFVVAIFWNISLQWYFLQWYNYVIKSIMIQLLLLLFHQTAIYWLSSNCNILTCLENSFVSQYLIAIIAIFLIHIV